MANEGAVIQIRKNGSGSQVGSHYAESTPPNNSNRDALMICGMVALNSSTDYVDLCILQQTGSTQNIQSDSNGDMTSFGGFKVA